jgi:hypothetical protein
MVRSLTARILLVAVPAVVLLYAVAAMIFAWRAS